MLGFQFGLTSRSPSRHSASSTRILDILIGLRPKRVVRYLIGTRDLGLSFHGASGLDLRVFSDADWAADSDDRRSISGYVSFLADGPVSWRTKKQQSTALSSTEAVSIAASLACQEIIWLKLLLTELGFAPDGPVTLLCDNRSSISLALDSRHHQQSKHIDIRFHFIREQITSGEVDLQYVPTDLNAADILTKGLQPFAIETQSPKFCLRPVPSARLRPNAPFLQTRQRDR